MSKKEKNMQEFSSPKDIFFYLVSSYFLEKSKKIMALKKNKKRINKNYFEKMTKVLTKKLSKIFEVKKLENSSKKDLTLLISIILFSLIGTIWSEIPLEPDKIMEGFEIKIKL